MKQQQHCEITSPELPGAIFYGYQALRRHASERLGYENACQEFARVGDLAAFTSTLADLGYDAAEIATHVDRPWHRIAEGFGVGAV